MTVASCITLKYGPYEVCGIVEHRTERLLHLKERIESDNYTVILKKWSHYDRLGIFFNDNDTPIFTCRLTFLQYPNILDPVCDKVYATISKCKRKSSQFSEEEVVSERRRKISEETHDKKSIMSNLLLLMSSDNIKKLTSKIKEIRSEEDMKSSRPPN
ncbi:UPF0728 protein C10orf53 homolog [Lycorma delicatula]|uniref:UPF0728 protein C10orf53 homolog n=1 Tax=Lycorma delicatula TaxID=130591 RepID=UPI003F511532